MYCTGDYNLRTVLEHRAQSDAGRTFLVFEGADGLSTEVSYGRFVSDVGRLGNGLRSLGVRAGDRVIIHLWNSPEFLVSLFAVASIGAVATPTIIHYAQDELRYVTEHSEAVAMITEADFLPMALAIKGAVPTLRSVLLARSISALEGAISVRDLMTAQEDRLPPVGIRSADPALLMYSSGTTARPKGILLSHEMAVFSGECNAQHERLRPEDRTMCVLPLFHVNALFISTLSTFVTGSSLALAERFNARIYWQQVRKYRATVGSLVAAPIRHLLAEEPEASDGVHELRMMLTGMPLTDPEIAEFERRFRVPLINLWGMTENAATGIRSPLYLERRPNLIGFPMLGYAMRAVDDEGRDVPTGEAGELLLQGPMMSGYFKNEDLTRDTVEDGWLHTGDNIRFTDGGYIQFVDRKKDMIKVSGENVASSEVELVLCQHPSVADCAVIGVPDPVRDEAVKALVVLRPDAAATATELQEHCRRSLAKFKMPTIMEFVESLPKTSIGKLQKGELRRSASSG